MSRTTLSTIIILAMYFMGYLGSLVPYMDFENSMIAVIAVFLSMEIADRITKED